MNILLIGRAFGMIGDSRTFLDCRGRYDIRTLAAVGEAADYTFAPGASAVEVYEAIAREWAPDLIVNWLPELCPPPPGIEHVACRTAAIISDWNLYAPEFHWNLARYDLLLSDKAGSLQYRPWGATPRYHGPLYGYHPLHHWNLGGDREIDVLFIGNLNPAIHQKRARLLEELRTLSGRYRIEILSGLWGDVYGQTLNRARIVFNHSIRGEMNLRAFEAPACGALLLQEEDNLEIRESLLPDEEVVLYSEETLIDRVEHFLTHEADRARIARQGNQRIQAWAPAARFDALAELLANQPAGPRQFRELAPAAQAAATLMQQAASASLSQRQAAQRQAAAVAQRHGDSPEALAAAARVTFRAAQEAGSLTQEALGQVLQWLKQSLAMAPESAPLWHNLSVICTLIGRNEVARQCAARALSGQDLTACQTLFGSYHDTAYVEWLRALAMGTASADMVHRLVRGSEG
jgi:hypothetical protein